jgi:DNA-binding NtrC family response regulator
MDRPEAVLVCDDDADVLAAARFALAGHVARVETASSVAAAEAALAAGGFEAVLLDMNFAVGDHSGAEGLVGLRRLSERDPELSIVLMTAFGGVALAVEALKRGAADFLLKPWRNEKLVETVLAAAAATRCRRASRQDLDLDTLERQAIERALARHEGNISHAATALGLTRPALYRRMAKHGL